MQSQSPSVVYEEDDFLIIGKPAGMLVHVARIHRKSRASNISGDSRHALSVTQDGPTLVEWLLGRSPSIKKVGDDPEERPGIVHRLDRDTSGAMAVAKTDYGFRTLKSLFMDHRIKKIYLALVHGVPREKTGIINMPIGIKSGTVKRTTREGKMMKEAITEYRVIREFSLGGPARHASQGDAGGERCSLLEVYPKTGRTHQIRVHLARIGHPVVGDSLYGHRKTKVGMGRPARLASESVAGRLMLHALSLEFSFTEKDGVIKHIRAEVEPPEEFRAVCGM